MWIETCNNYRIISRNRRNDQNIKLNNHVTVNYFYPLEIRKKEKRGGMGKERSADIFCAAVSEHLYARNCVEFEEYLKLSLILFRKVNIERNVNPSKKLLSKWLK